MCLRPQKQAPSSYLCVCVCVCVCEEDEWLSESMWDDKIWINKNTPEDIQSIHVDNNTEILTFDLEIGKQNRRMRKGREIETEKG